MRLLEEETNEDDLIRSVLEECAVHCNGFAYASMIRYCFQLLDKKNNDLWWKSCVNHLSMILNSAKRSLETQLLLSRQNLDVSRLERCVEIMMTIYEEHSIPLMSDFFTETTEITDLLIRGCVSEVGYQVRFRLHGLNVELSDGSPYSHLFF